MGLFREPWLIAAIILLAIVLFGAAKLPDIARNLGKSAKVMKEELADLRNEQPTTPAAPPVVEAQQPVVQQPVVQQPVQQPVYQQQPVQQPVYGQPVQQPVYQQPVVPQQPVYGQPVEPQPVQQDIPQAPAPGQQPNA